MKKLSASIPFPALLALAVAALAATVPAAAQDSPPPLLSIHVDHVKLGHDADYAGAVKKLWAALDKEGADFPVTAYQSVSSPGDYTFVLPLSSLADVDHHNATFTKVLSAHTSLMAELARHLNGAESSVIATRPDLSYTPASPRVSAADQGYAHVTFLHVKPEHAMDLEAAIREYGELAKKKGVADGFGVFTPVIGEMPVYALRVVARSEADFYAQRAKTEETMGAEGAELRARVGPMLHKIETSASVPRPDLSYQP